MDFEGANEIWKYDDPDSRIKPFLEDLVTALADMPISHRENYIKNILRDLFEEKKILGDLDG